MLNLADLKSSLIVKCSHSVALQKSNEKLQKRSWQQNAGPKN